jgi:hypothetical protein
MLVSMASYPQEQFANRRFNDLYPLARRGAISWLCSPKVLDGIYAGGF